MAEQLFIRILNMSLTGSFVILAVLAVRFLLHKAPRIFSYCLWAVVLFRLLCPISFSAVFSPFNALSSPSVEQGRIEYIPEDILSLHQSATHSVYGAAHTVSITPDGSTASFSESAPTAGTIGSSSADFAITAASIIWFFGIFLIALYSIVMLLHLKQKLKNAAWERDNIYVTEEISTPFVMGFVKPRIYLPLALEKEEKHYVLLHEQIHIKRLDHIIKILAFIALCIHWFNPFVWVAFFLSGKDMEMSCDESVIQKLGNGMKKEYSASL